MQFIALSLYYCRHITFAEEIGLNGVRELLNFYVKQGPKASRHFKCRLGYPSFRCFK